jgi:acyl carrier protein
MENAATPDRETIERKVREIVASSLEADLADVKLTSALADELGAQSLDLLDIAFRLEREFKIQFPRTDIWERATAHFGAESLMVDGVVTDFGLELMRRGMPEVRQEQLKPGMQAVDVMRMLTVNTFVRIVTRLLEVKAAIPRACPSCGAATEEADAMPEFVCPSCGTTVPLPSGDDILLQDLIALAGEIERG